MLGKNRKDVLKIFLITTLLTVGCNEQTSSSKSQSVSSSELSSTSSSSISDNSSSITDSSSVSSSTDDSSSSYEEKEMYYVKEYEYVNLYEGKDKLIKEQEDESKPRITLEKDTFAIGEPIVVNGYNVSSTDWVGIFPYGGHPTGMDALTWSYFNTNTVTLTGKTFENETKYVVYLLKDGGYEVLDYKEYTLYSPSSNKYSVENPKFILEEETKEFYVALTPSTSKEITYEIYWAKDGKRLENYSYIKTFKKASETRFSYPCGKNIYMPNEANQIEVRIVSGIPSSYFADIKDVGKLEYSKYLYSFNVMSDLHIADNLPFKSVNLMSALNNAYSKNRDSKGLFIVGDPTNDGTKESYELLRSIMDVYSDTSKTKIYYALGNHEYIYSKDYNGQVNLFKQYTEMDGINYCIEMEDSMFIVMGSDSGNGVGTMSASNVNWLIDKLDNANQNKPTYLFFHQPLKDTTAGSYAGQNWYGMTNADGLKEKLEKYKNLFIFTGHTHWELESNNTIYTVENGPTYINDSSVGYLWNDDDAGEPGSEGLFIDVYEDYILVKGMDFTTNKWLPYAMYCLPIE